MKVSSILMFFITLCSIQQMKAQRYNIKQLDRDKIISVVDTVVKWQIEAYPRMNEQRFWKSVGDLSWENGVFLAALAEWSEYIQDDTLISWYEDIADRNKWQTCPNRYSIYFADDLIVSLMYRTLYEKRKNKKIIEPTLARLEYIVNNPSQGSLYMGEKGYKERWSWCDALYMAPPVFAAFASYSVNPNLIDFMNNEFWASYDHLFDQEEKLFYRDSNQFEKREKNGEKVFWGRGNAWVVAGLAQIIQELPDHYSPKAAYVNLFKTMMQRITPLQDEEGFWHASLLDPDSYPVPETSSTAFFSYCLWWGINNGILDKGEYISHAIKGWNAIVNAVQPDGMLGWVQPVGADPQQVTSNMTEVYGAGAMMKTAKQILLYLEKNN